MMLDLAGTHGRFHTPLPSMPRNKICFRRIAGLLPLILAALVLTPRLALAAPVQAEHVEVELLAENTTLAPGENWLGLRIQPEAGWHVYWRNPGDSGLPTKLNWKSLPAGAKAGDLQWPYPHEHRLGSLVNYGYGENTLLPLVLSLPAGAKGPFQATAQWLVCADVCIPGRADLQLDVPVSPNAPAADPANHALFAAAHAALPKPANFAVRYQIDHEEFRLAAGPLPGDSQTLAFYPYPPTLINHAGEARQQFEGREARLSRPISSYFVEAPPQVDGVLLLGEGAQAQAYEFVATPGVVAPLSVAKPVDAAADNPSLPLALLLAFAGGLILNLMPCVFPVLSLKALSMLKTQGQNGSEQRRQALAYTGGVVASFLLAAGLLIALRSGGTALGWGFQLQSPFFVGLLIYVMVALGLSLSGLVQFGSGWMGVGQTLAERPGLSGSFFTGVLAVLVASPCTAPFMGTALGFALTQPALASLSIFLALGLGLAFPFLLLGFVPRLAAWLPRPGAWMERLKQILAFPLYLTAVWLLWVLGGLSDRNGMALALIGVIALAFGLWLLGSTRGWLPRLLAVAALAGAVGLLLVPTGSDRQWEPYSDTRFEELRAQQKTVFVDFTADWCLTCKVNERVALKSQTVAKAFAENKVTTLVADWTRADPAITATLARYGRSGVPLYLVSRKGGEPEILPQVLTPDLVAQAVTSH